VKWAEISIHTTQEAIEPVANILHDIGANGVVIEDPEVLFRDVSDVYGEVYQLNPNDYPIEGVILKGYVPVNCFLGEAIEAIKDALNHLLICEINLGRGTLTMTEVQEEDWAHNWKKYYKPVQITEKITITPSWEDYRPISENEQIIELDPGMAFGTGTHPTTVLCIQALEKIIPQGARVIDVGCGSGVLSIAAMKLGAHSCLALDLDEIAIKASKENIKINKMSDGIKVKQNNLLHHIDEQADVIVANILAEIILRCVDQAYQNLRLGGYFITSGIIYNKHKEVEEALLNQGFKIMEILSTDDWVAFIAKKE
jgi:ribosomal protein L11 methyltransferase